MVIAAPVSIFDTRAEKTGEYLKIRLKSQLRMRLLALNRYNISSQMVGITFSFVNTEHGSL